MNVSSKNFSLIYAIKGVLFGTLFPIIGTTSICLSFDINIVEAQKSHFLLWIMNILPLLLGGLSYLAGKERTKLEAVNINLQYYLNEQSKELAMAKENLSNTMKLSAVGEMSAGIVHEINNPITILSGFIFKAERLLEQTHINKNDIKGCFKKQRKAISRIQKIINSLKKVSKNGEGDPFELINLKSLIDESVEFGISHLKHKNIEFSLSCENNIQIEGQFVQLSQVIINFINNAKDAIINNSGKKWIQIKASSTEGLVKISITDSGVGIPKSIQDRIMEPFFSTKAPGKGTGLGLSICQKIIQSHGGHIEINNDSSHTEFIITLPQKIPDHCLTPLNDQEDQAAA